MVSIVDDILNYIIDENYFEIGFIEEEFLEVKMVVEVSIRCRLFFMLLFVFFYSFLLVVYY